MEFNIILTSSTSITLELINEDIYNTKDYNIYINDILYKSKITTNVYSIFNLTPNTLYKITVEQEEKNNHCYISTENEYVCLNVKRFNAKGDGISNDTSFIQACINSCPDNGRVYFPKGTYYIGPLFLRSNITIELAKDAILLGDVNRFNYPILPGITYTTDEKDEYNLGTWEGNPLDCFASIITGINVQNVKIIGEGIIDCNSQNSNWWINIKNKIVAWRPRGVFLNRCNNIAIQGITITNTPSWNLHPYFSNNLKFIDLKLINPKDSPNTDGCDPESCDNVDIIGAFFSVGDDCIAIKSGKIFMGRKYKKPSSNFNIRNCSMNYGHGAVVLGSEMSGGIKNINVSKCIFNGTDRGLRIKTRRGRGKDAIIDNISFENIEMINVLTPLVINMFYYCDPDGHKEYVYSKEKLEVNEKTPYLGRFKFKNINCRNVNIAAGVFYGLPEQPIKYIELENIYFEYAINKKCGIPAMMDFLDEMSGRGLIFMNVDTVKLKNVKFNRIDSQRLDIINVKKIEEIN